MSNVVLAGESYIAMKEQAETLVKSGFLPPTIKTAEQAMAIAMKGREVGMAMMQSFSHINIIGGKPCISAEGMNFLIRKNSPGAKIAIIERTITICKIKAKRANEDHVTEFSFSIEDAKRASLLANPSWQKYPRHMLFARCFSEMARTLFPDAIGGLSYTPEDFNQTLEVENETPS